MSNHRCPYPDCESSVPASMLACRPHWFAISKATRDAVWTSWRSGDSTAHGEAVAAAVAEMHARAAGAR